MSTLNFDDIAISTITAMCYSNVLFDIERLYERLPVYEVKNPPMKKKKQIPEIKKVKAPYGKIVSVQYRKQFRGLITKAIKPQSEEKKSKHFLNQITCIISLGDINLNVFIFKSSFKISGCKNMNVAQAVIRVLWEIIEPLKDTYSFLDDKCPNFVFESVMTNIDFLLGFNIDRKCLNTLLNDPKYCEVIKQSRYEPTTDINVKIQLKANEPDQYSYYQLVRIPKKSDCDGSCAPERADGLKNSSKWVLGQTETPNQKSTKKTEKKTTFMVFRSSKTIMSSRYKDNMQRDFNYFMNIINQYKNSIQEKEDTPQPKFVL